MRGIILSGGYGTRLQPFTLVSNKHMAPVYSRKLNQAVPMIFFPINTFKKSGIEDILIITSREHCGHIVQTLGDGEEMGVKLSYSIQEMDRSPTGIAQALHLAKPFICDEPFAVILGDNFYEDTFEKEVDNFQKKYDVGNFIGSSIFLKQVDDPERFGVATISGENGKPGNLNTLCVDEIVEKPENPKTNWAVTGLYFYTPHVFEIIKTLKPSGRGELEISDNNNWYVKNGLMSAYALNGFWHDMGTPDGILSVTEFLDGE